MKTVRIAQLQMVVQEDKKENLYTVQAAMEQLRGQGVDLVALPEMFCCPYQTERFLEYAESIGGRVWSFCSEMAGKYGVYVAAGSIPERGADGRIYNSAFVFDRMGRQIAVHRKVHLFDIAVDGGQHFCESDTLAAGSAITVFETEFCQMGLCICYDIRFPELTRLMALKGAEVILVPAAFNLTTGPAHWELLFRARALDNQVFMVGTAPARNAAAVYQSWGHSIVTDPWGNVLAQMDQAHGYQIVTLPLAQIGTIRSQLPLLQQRRTDIYQVTEKAGEKK